MRAKAPRLRAWVYLGCAALYAAIASLDLYEAIAQGDRTRSNEISLLIALLAVVVMLFAAYSFRHGSR